MWPLDSEKRLLQSDHFLLLIVTIIWQDVKQIAVNIHRLAKKSHHLDLTKQISKGFPLDNYCSD